MTVGFFGAKTAAAAAAVGTGTGFGAGIGVGTDTGGDGVFSSTASRLIDCSMTGD